MKTYLTKNGLLVVRDDAAFFTNNSGEFRRLASQDEVEYLTKQVIVPMCSPAVGLPLVDIGPVDFSKEGISGIVMHATLIRMEIPLWHYLWTIRSSDYSSYRSETSCNGGDYAFHTRQSFYARYVEGVWEIRSITSYETSAEFEYDELSGRFQTGLNRITAIGIAPYKLEDKNGAYEEPCEEFFMTQTASGQDEEIALDKLLDAQNYTLEDVLEITGYYIPEADSEDEEGFLPLEEAEKLRRKEIVEKLGIAAPPKRRSSGK